MATFTMTLSEIMEQRGNITVADSLKDAHVLGLDMYPIFDEGYRDILNDKILRRYWNQEIAHETVEMFRFRMHARMNEIMPYWNQMFESTKIKFDPISTMDITTVADNATTHNESSTNLATNTADSNARTVNSIMPQVHLSENGDYADSANDNATESKNTSNANTTGEGEQSAKVNSNTKGYQGLPADLLRRYRETLLNVDMMVLDDVKTLFMAVWSSDDSYFYTQENYLTRPFLFGTYI